MKARTIKYLIPTTIQIYNQNWEIIDNETAHPFMTSDHPMAIDYSGRPGIPVVNFLPLSPKLCLRIEWKNIINIDFEKLALYLQTPPMGTIQRNTCSPEKAKSINGLVIKSAEKTVFSSQEEIKMPTLIKKYGHYRIDVDYLDYPGEDNSLYQRYTLCVRKT